MMKSILCRLRSVLKRHVVFIKILAYYLVGSTLLLLLFSTVLTWYLTKRATEDVMSNSQDAINQMYSATNYILNDAYDSYFQLYQTVDMNTAMFGRQSGVEEQLTVSRLFQRAHPLSSCVDSIYIINRSLDKVYTDQGAVSTLDAFYDKQALQLFNLYNENSSTIFLPRAASFTRDGTVVRHNYVTLIFARIDALSSVSGGLIVNIDQSKLQSLITADLKSKDNMYIVTNTGSIISNGEPASINTTLQGTGVWNRVTADQSQKSMVFTENYQGIPCIVTSKKADRLLFYFLSIVPFAEAQEKVAYIRNFTVSISVILMVFAFAIAMIGSRSIYSPISKLVTNLQGRKKEGGAQEPAMDEFAFLNSAYDNLCSEVESLSSDKAFFARAQMREMLIRLLRGEYSSEEKCRAQFEKYGLLPRYAEFLVAVMRFDNFAEMVKQHSAQDISLFKYAMINVATELFGEKCDVMSTENGLNYVTLILNLPATNEETEGWVHDVMEHVNRVMKQHMGFTISTGIGTAVQTLVQLSASYSNALTAADYRMVLGQSAVISFKAISTRQNLMPEYPAQTETELIQAIRARNYEKACAELDEFFARISVANMDYINMSLLQLTISLNRILKLLAVSKEVEKQFNYRSFSVRLGDCDTLEQKKVLLLDFCREIIEVRNSEVQSKKNKLIERTCEFIRANYANPMIDVENIAEYAELSSSYLRTIFKEVIGKTPNEYITDYRIEKAKELLETTDYNTKEIAVAVGYLNHRYFYSVFKSKTGQTATDYRHTMKKKEKVGTTL